MTGKSSVRRGHSTIKPDPFSETLVERDVAPRTRGRKLSAWQVIFRDQFATM
jgi:hypothetical protein